MIRPFTLGSLTAAVCLAAFASPASAQFGARTTQAQVVTQVAAFSHADVRGVIHDDSGNALQGAVVSALGPVSVFAVSDADGRFIFRNLPFGPYLLRAHLQGYVSPQARSVRVDRESMDLSTIALTAKDGKETPRVLAAGIGTAGVAQPADADSETENHDHGEVAWRLRHLKRGALKDDSGFDFGGQEPADDPLQVLGRFAEGPAQFATALFSEIPFSGEVNLLTTASFDRPQDLFSSVTPVPRPIAFVSLEAPTTGGVWSAQGAVTQGDLASWILAGSFASRRQGAHQYEAGVSYAMQRYLGGNASALAAVADGARNAGALYAYDSWTLNPSIAVSYGAKWSRYDYLSQRNLFSPRLSIVVTPSDNEKAKIRATVSRRVMAPGAEEFIPPVSGIWLPPERTFSPLSMRRGFSPEYTEHMEIAAERDWIGDVLIGVRAFRQQVDNQIVTLFGVELPGRAPSNIGHYYVASGGSFDAIGWGISVSRPVGEGVRASFDYSYVATDWNGPGSDVRSLSRVAPGMLRAQAEHIHDITTSLESVLPVTDTRIFVIYKINTAFGDPSATTPVPGVRFDVQLNQALPFMNFTSAQWEMLVAVRNLFRDELLDASVYDELMVVRPPKRVVGGVTVRF